MKLKSLRIENFRAFADETIEFGNYNCLVGPNGAGKSTVLNALNVFFREADSSSLDLVNLCQEDFHAKDTTKTIRITVIFADLNDRAKSELKEYVRHDKLVIFSEAKWDPANNYAPVKQYGARMGIKEFAPYFQALGDGKTKDELVKAFTLIQQTFPEIKTAKTKEGMTDALRSYEASHSEKCELIPSEDQFYGVSRGENRLAKFIQWVFVPAVKDAISEQTDAKNTALGKLLERTVQAKVKFSEQITGLRKETEAKYQIILDGQQSALDAVSQSLKDKLTQWSHPGAQVKVKWDKDPLKSVRVEPPFAKIVAGEGMFEGELSRLGHGLQRSYLLALLHELAGTDDPEAPRLLLAIEEPELFQHPPQAQHLAEVLEILSAETAQILACTHSPYFVVGRGFEDVRLIRKTLPTGPAKATCTTFQDVASRLAVATGEIKYTQAVGVRAKMHQALQPGLKEMFFCPVLVLVEGLEDVAYITAGLHLLNLWGKWRQIGGHIVPVNGKSELLQPLVIAQLMRIPTFVVFDADGAEKNPQKRKWHETDNSRLLAFLGQNPVVPFPEDTLWLPHFTVWSDNMGNAIQSDYSLTDWQEWKDSTEQIHGQIGGLNKNSLYISDILGKAWDAGKPSPKLRKLCEAILAFAVGENSPAQWQAIKN